jgi:hypothetical protein
MSEGDPSASNRTVFVVHGRNDEIRKAMFEFLRAIGLNPLEWSEAIKRTGQGAPFIGQVLDTAFNAAQAVVVLMTPDEIAYLRSEYASGLGDPEAQASAQARPNVLFEAGLAFGRHPDRTILVECGSLRGFSDVAGRHAIRMADDSESRNELAGRLATAGCDVNTSGKDWLSAGDFTPPPDPGDGLPMGKRLARSPSTEVRVTAKYRSRDGKGSGYIRVTNHCPFDVYNLTVELPPEASSVSLHADFPIKRLPAGESINLHAITFMGGGSDHFDVTIRAEHDDGTPIEVLAFVSLND